MFWLVNYENSKSSRNSEKGTKTKSSRNFPNVFDIPVDDNGRMLKSLKKNLTLHRSVVLEFTSIC